MGETVTMTITEFLLARIAEDEATARAASPAPWQFGSVESVAGGSLYDTTRMIGAVHYEQRADHDGSIVRHLLSDEANANGLHIARHDPARVLAECAAKRRIVEWHKMLGAPSGFMPNCEGCWEEGGEDGAPLYPCRNLRWLGAIYADHPEYREEWAD